MYEDWKPKAIEGEPKNEQSVVDLNETFGNKKNKS